MFNEYGEFLSSLQGVYIGAEDVGLNVRDIGYMFEKTRFVTCIPTDYGGSANPSQATAKGVVCGMEGALSYVVNKETAVDDGGG